MRTEGLTELLGDINLQCSGSNPGTVLSGNLTLLLPVSVTNRVDTSNLTRDAILYIDLGSGPVNTAIAGQVAGNSISFNGVSYTLPASGNVGFRISGVRGAITQLGTTGTTPSAVTGSISSTLFSVNQSQVVLAYAQPGRLSNMGQATITCYGSALPDTIDLPNLFAAGTALASTRITEGFASAFQVRSAGTDTGSRILVKYTDFPASTRLFIPDMVSGSGSLQPTSGGDLNLPQQVGKYMPGDGSLLLVRVQGADANGVGGLSVAAPTGSTPITLSSVSEVTLTNGAGYAVYEVVAANPAVRETAQFPTFIGLPRLAGPAMANETVTAAPVSTVAAASATAPIPRFANVPMQSDCSIFGDCVTQAPLPPRLRIEASPIQISAVAGGGAMTSAPGTFKIHNDGAGSMDWSISVIYQSGNGWLVFNPAKGTNDATVSVTADTKTLTAGTSLATVIVNAGAAGAQSVPVILTVTAAPTTTPPASVTPTVVVNSVLNAATLQAAPMVPGSLGTLMGSHLAGKNVVVTFDGTPATLLYTSETQINLQVPAALGSKTQATMVVTVDGVSSAPVTVPLTVAFPAVFSHGVFNQDNSENTANSAAKAGDILQIFATGVPKLSTVSVQIGDRKDLVPVYAGEAPTAPGVQQVNVAVPQGVSGSVSVLICASTNGSTICSPGAPVTVR